MRIRPQSERGFTLVELVIVTAIVGILASAVLPLARWSVKRSKEHELQQNLRILRNAIDRYRDAAAAGIIEVPEGASGFPESLDALVEGIPMIAEMPVPVPAVGGEYDATGPGLTGGLQRLMEQQQAMGGMAGGDGFGGAGGMDDFGDGFDDDEGGPGLRPSPGSAFGSRGGSGSGSSFGSRSTFGSRSATGMQSGGRTAGSAFGSSGLQLGGQSGQAGQRPGGMTSSGAGGSSFGLQRPGGGTFGSLGGAFGQQGADNQPAEPILGPDGQPLKLVLLRRIPIDPFTGEADWGLRCYGEPPADRLWCGKDVFDIYSKSPAKAIDGTNYRDW